MLLLNYRSRYLEEGFCKKKKKVTWPWETLTPVVWYAGLEPATYGFAPKLGQDSRSPSRCLCASTKLERRGQFLVFILCYLIKFPSSYLVRSTVRRYPVLRLVICIRIYCTYVNGSTGKGPFSFHFNERLRTARHE